MTATILEPSPPREIRPPGAETAPGRRRPSPAVVIRLARLAGVLTVLPLVSAPVRRLLGTAAMLPVTVSAAVVASALTTAAGSCLLVLASGLRRRKRRAWQVSVVACVVDLSATVVGRHPLVPALVVLALLAFLVSTRAHFTAVPDPVGSRFAVRTPAVLAGTGFLAVFAMVSVRPRLVFDRPTLGERSAHAALSLIGVEGPVRFRSGWLDGVTSAVGLSFGIVAVLVAGYFLLRSAEPAPHREPEDAARLRSLLARHGSADSLGFFALRGDKSLAFSRSGKAAVSYRVLAGVALASGDPVGDLEAWPAAIAEYLDRCRRHGWVPAVLGCSEAGARVWTREGGLDALELGDEAVVEVGSFTLEGRSMRAVRQAVGRARRAGYETSVRRVRDVPREELHALVELGTAWRGVPEERGFSMALSRLADPDDEPDAVLVVATLDGVPHGFLQFVPWGAHGLSLDRMIRDPQVTLNGLNELLIAEALTAARTLGVERISLNFAVFRAALEQGERVGAGPVARLWARGLRLLSRRWQIDSLYRFNARFGPRWVPRYLVFGGVRDLPRIVTAALEAEGFGGRPRRLLRVLRRGA